MGEKKVAFLQKRIDQFLKNWEKAEQAHKEVNKESDANLANKKIEMLNKVRKEKNFLFHKRLSYNWYLFRKYIR